MRNSEMSHGDPEQPGTNGRDPTDATGHGQGRPPSPAEGVPAWLKMHRTAIPSPAIGYLDRPALTKRCLPTKRRITLVQAPGGFGKTTLLAQACRTASAQGVATAWLTLDEQDEASALEIYLALAVHRAGIDVFKPLRPTDGGSSPPHTRIDVLLRALRERRGVCILVLDETERVTDPECVALLNRLAASDVPGLHLALSGRELPHGLNIAAPVFGGAVEILSAEDLRFSRQDIQGFFDDNLSRRELTAVTAGSAGWPLAVRIEQNARKVKNRSRDRVVREVAHNWIESRLFDRLAEDDRELLLDAGLLDWMDTELLDEVLTGADLMARIESLPALSGLIEPVRGSRGNVWRLHPLIRGYCSERRRQLTPKRLRLIHRRIANALTQRGETVAAMRHAAKARDDALIGRILSDAGGIRLMFQEGQDRLVAADRFLTEKTLAMYPRLAFVRSVAHIVVGRLREARQSLDIEARSISDGKPGDVQRDADWCVARSLLFQNACESLASEPIRRLVPTFERLAESPSLEPQLRASMEYALCQVHNYKAEFDAAQNRADRARRWLGPQQGLLMLLDLQAGQAAMAQGRVPDAHAAYQRARANATRALLDDPRLVILGEVLTRELDLERNRIARSRDAGKIPSEYWQTGAQFSSYAAASAMAAELTLADEGAEAALATVNLMLQHAYDVDLPVFVRHLSGLRVSLLVEAGEVGMAERYWRAQDLPRSTAQCVDLKRQSWREMETLCCARLRLLVAQRKFDDGRALVRDLVGVASGRGLRRVLMRTLAIAVVLEESAGDRAAAIECLTSFVDLYAKTDYARALVRERAVAVPVLSAFLDANPQSPHRDAAQTLLGEAMAGGATLVPALSTREAEILERMDSQTDRQIGSALGITRDGVRYHAARLFAKLNVHDRKAAVRRARSLGLLPSKR